MARPARAPKRQRVDDLLRHHRRTRAPGFGEKLRFAEVGRKDVYNPTRPFCVNGRRVLAARVESRHKETDSQIWFFQKRGDAWTPIAGTPRLSLQDPFVTRVGNELILGGVEVDTIKPGAIRYRTAFYRGKSLHALRRFATGPDGMKDIRLAELQNGRILVLTRPQGRKGGRGKIGYTVIDNLDALTPDAIARAPLIRHQFQRSEWGGANEIHVLDDNTVGVLGHIARFDRDGGRHYYPMAFTLDLSRARASAMKILLERSQLPPGPAKKADLKDVVFTGGLERGAGAAMLYVGASDAEVHRARIPDPFRANRTSND
jgi:hypothetical protein